VTTLTVRDVEPGVKERLRIRAAQSGHSMEEEVRIILRAATADDASSATSLADAIRARFASFGGIELVLPAREPLLEVK
jgi:plasmid stability protein